MAVYGLIHHLSSRAKIPCGSSGQDREELFFSPTLRENGFAISHRSVPSAQWLRQAERLCSQTADLLEANRLVRLPATCLFKAFDAAALLEPVDLSPIIEPVATVA